MELLPAIDLRGGHCVRLIQGDYDRQLNYNDDPVAQAGYFEQCGATWLHMVDLDGAKDGQSHHFDIIKSVAESTGLNLEVGGGIRSEATVKKMLDIGVKHVVLGTKALEEFDWFGKLVFDYPGHIVLGLDARDGMISIRGWTETSSLSVEEMAGRVTDWPLAAIVYTDIARDGMLTGPNVEATGALAKQCGVPVIASGGVSKLEDIKALAPLPLFGIITGRALYEGTLDLAEALAVVRSV